MDKSKNYGFNLPSRDTDDIADINQISENFRIIDEELSGVIKGKGVDQVYNAESRNPQSGKAISGELVNYVKYESEDEWIFDGGDSKNAVDIDLIIDNEMSPTSENLVKNKAIFEAIRKSVDEAKLLAHPIGSLYWSENPTDPAELFGGTWERVKDKFILAAGDEFSSGDSGGEAEVTLTVETMPNHSHVLAWDNEGAASPSSGSGVLMKPQGSDTLYAYQSGYAGEGKPHNNMPPYEVYYCFKRIG